ncbi:MAG: fibronectin type III domain-containing protein, partial [Clostridia bacterium]|nr:fibronectin type III domain-containing protein [Clostridia bacterium]
SSVNDTFATSKASKQYTLYVSVSGNAGLKGAKFSVKYDSNLQFVGSSVVEGSNVFNRLESVGYNFNPTENIKGILEYNIYPSESYSGTLKDSTENGKIVSITFKLKKYAIGNYPVEFGGLTYNPKDFQNVAGSYVPCSFQAGGIKITGAKPATPKISSVTLTKKTVAKITWKKVANAKSYQVYQSVGSSKSYKKIATVKTNTCTVKKLKAAKKYNFKVRAIGTGTVSGYSAIKSVTPLNYKTKAVIKSAKSTKKKTAKVTIKKKIAGATGYQIQYANNKKFKSSKKTTTKTLTKTIKKLTSKKTYYVRVRTFNKVNGKVKYGKWSKVKTVKVK